ncbi:MAG: phage tail tape measure protein [Faecalibacterium prausnitzii]|nr:phage tail tape measure protein [Faecalibacterium prausnitzii]
MADFSITGDTRLDTSGFNKGLSAMSVAAGSLIADLVQSATSQMAGLVKASVNIGAAFETSLAKVGTIADAGKLSVEDLSRQVLATSTDMGIAAADIAEAAYQAISAGQDTTDAVAFAGKAAKLAAAGFTSSSAAVDILTTALNAYGMSADQADHVSDVLLTTQNLGKTSVDELASSMGRVIPLAAAYNVSVENLSGTLAVMTANGIATAEATTYTKSMLNELGSAGSKVGKILQAETGKSFAQLNAEGKSLGDVLQILYDSVGGNSTAFAGLWSSVEAGTGALSLANSGADRFNAVLDQMQNSTGATEAAYSTMTDTLQHRVDSLQTAAQNLGITLYEQLEPSLGDAAQWGTDCLTTLTSALSEGGPEAMLAAAGDILASLTCGIAEQLPGLMTTGVEIITQLAQSLTDTMPAMLDTGAEVLAALAQGIINATPALLTSATEIIAEFMLYLGDHADEIMDAGMQLLESLIIGITDNLPQLITSAAGLIAKWAAALIAHLPDILKCGAAMLTTLVDGIFYSLENLAEAALACVAKLLGVWDGSYSQWGNIGTNIVKGLWEGIKSGWNGLLAKVKGLVDLLPDIAKKALGIHSPSKVFDEIGVNTCKGLAQGLARGTAKVKDAAETVVASVTDTATRLVDGVTTIAADGTKTVSKTIEDAGPQYASAGEMLTTQLRTKLTQGWEQIRSDIQTDALGAVKTLATALKNGDLESLGLWAASYFWHACTQKQQEQITALAMGALDQLGSALNGVLGNLSQLAMGLVAKFVPAAAAATGGQTALNLAMEANPILLVISLIGMLVGALLNFSGKNKEVAAGFQSVWAGVEDFMSYIFEGLLRIVAAGIEGFVLLINGLIGVYNLVAKLWGGQVDYISNPAWDYADKIAADRKARQAERKKQQVAANDPDPAPGSGSGGSGGTGTPGTPATDTDKQHTAAVEANTAALLAANSKLAQMVRKADTLVLSDNMAVSRTVAASGTAQIAAAAGNYRREGDTTVNQYIYSKAQTAADLARETRWEADRAKGHKR